MIRPRQELRTQIISPTYEPPTLHLANHPIRQIRRHLLQARHNLLFPLHPPLGPTPPIPKQPLPLLDLGTLLRQLLDLGLEQGLAHDGIDHAFREAIVEDGLADEVVVGPPAGTGHVQADFFEEVKGRLAEARHVLDQVAFWAAILGGAEDGLDVAGFVEGDLVAEDLEVGGGGGGEVGFGRHF